MPVTGAYTYTLANNYNGALRPPVVFCRDGQARLAARGKLTSTCWRCTGPLSTWPGNSEPAQNVGMRLDRFYRPITSIPRQLANENSNSYLEEDLESSGVARIEVSG